MVNGNGKYWLFLLPCPLNAIQARLKPPGSWFYGPLKILGNNFSFYEPSTSRGPQICSTQKITLMCTKWVNLNYQTISGSIFSVISTCIKCGSLAQMIPPLPGLSRVKIVNILTLNFWKFICREERKNNFSFFLCFTSNCNLCLVTKIRKPEW